MVRKPMKPLGSGSPSSNNCARVRERMPSAPINSRTLEGSPIFGRDRDAVAVVLELRDHGVGLERDQRLAAAGVEQHVMQVDAVDDDVGMLETGAERRPGRHPRDFVAGQRIEHQHGGRRVGLFEHRCAHADPIERVKDVGAELDAVADGAELGAPSSTRAARP